MEISSVQEIIRAANEMPDEAVNVDENYIKGVGKLDSRLIIILDLNKSLLFL